MNQKHATLFALEKRTLMLVLSLLLVACGLLAFFNLGQLEDPTFTIKTAMVATSYPGASPAEVEEEVTDVIEEAVQSLSQLKEVYSISQEGYSFVYIDIKDSFNQQQLPQVWDELRRKVNDTQAALPPKAGPSQVKDDFGDVYGVFFALTGAQYSNAQLKDFADELKKELLQCRDVAKIAIWGYQQEAVFVEFRQAQLARLGLGPGEIIQTLNNQNQVQDSGKVKVDEQYLRVSPTGSLDSEEQIADLLIGRPGGLVRLRDVARIERGIIEPPRNAMYYNGQSAVGIGISTQQGGNVVLMGEAIAAKLEQYRPQLPDGLALHTIYNQSTEVTGAVNIFLTNLLQAVLIVIVLLMLFMGWRSGMLIGTILLLTILGTFIGMYIMGIALQKVSLGALILALGMLVDNAIVVIDAMLVRMERGVARVQAAVEAVRATRWPLFGATIVAILAFTAIGFSPGNVGEFCRSLFYVLALSLSISWILAITLTPLLGVLFLKLSRKKSTGRPHAGIGYRFYRYFLHLACRFRWLVVLVTLASLGLAMYGFQYVSKAFFPDSTKEYFYVNFWNPQGTHLAETEADIAQLDHYLRTLDGVAGSTAFVGEGGLRFILSYEYQTPNSSYGQLLVAVEDYRRIPQLKKTIEAYMKKEFPQAQPFVARIPNGPGNALKIEARFSGPDAAVLKDLAARARQVFEDSNNARDLRTDWRQPVALIRPQFSQTRARFAGISRNDLATAIQWNFNGIRGGLLHEEDELIPIVFRSPEQERAHSDNLHNLQVWSALNRNYVPLRQVIDGIERVQEYPLIHRRERRKTVTVQCNPRQGLADSFLQTVRGDIERISLPPGYTLEWGGEYRDSVEAQAGLKRIFPLCLLGMFVTVVWMFNSFRRPLIIFACVPLSLVGVTGGLLVSGLPFGFMAILGFLGLSGMLIKNAIVLIDQVELDILSGSPRYRAVLDASVSRVRPVIMASGTTILGMTPLIFNPFYSSMAATIMSGLLVATFLTLVLVPVLYTLVYRVKAEQRHV